VNGDGVDDLLVSAAETTTGIGSPSGHVYIVFWKKIRIRGQPRTFEPAGATARSFTEMWIISAAASGGGRYHRDGFATSLGGSGADPGR